MTGVELLLATGAVAGKELIKKSVTSLFETCSARVEKSIKLHKNEKNISRFYQQLTKVRKVKTLGQLDKAVDLTTFYCDSHVYLDKKRAKINQISDIPCKGNVLIEGIAGQGKSIFLRYLASVEAIKGDVVPIFAELRRIKSKQSLVSFLLDTLKFYSFNVDESILSELADSGRLIFLLDAFDEVADQSKSRIIYEIEYFVASHPNCRMIITSRPESGISAATSFECIKLSNLEKVEYIDVINTITEDAELARGLILQIEEHKGRIRDLLITPLLVTLLVIRYKSFQELPTQLSDFYDSLFQLLLQRHDGLKPGYRRARGCKMNDFQYRQVFEVFCFQTKKCEGKVLTQELIYKAAEAALKEVRIKEDAEVFVCDIVKITCLLVKDGEEFRFIHKSVQEYYTASYIRHKPETVASSIYGKVLSMKIFWIFQQELRFLSEIDSYKYQKYGIIPFLEGQFKITRGKVIAKPSSDTLEAIEKAIVRHKVGYVTGPLKENIGEIRSVQLPYFGPFSDSAVDVLDSVLYRLFFYSKTSFKDRSPDEMVERVSVERYLEVFGTSEMKAGLKKGAREIAKLLMGAVATADRIVSTHDQLDPLSDFKIDDLNG